MNRICVYTCITGNYDNIKEIDNKEKGIDYYCFTNNKKLKSKTWNVVYIENNEELSNVKLARKIKIMGHPSINKKYDILLWMDGSVTFNKSIKKFINHYLTKEDNFVAFKHAERNNIKDECYACIKMRKETKENVVNIMKFYEKEKYNYDNGLIESTVYIKRTKNKQVDETLKIWFDMIINFSKRDQLSFNYAIHKTKLNVKWINEKVFNNNWFSCDAHNFEKEIKSYRVYFNDLNNNEYNIENDFQGDFCLDGGTYYIELIVPCNTKKTVVELSRIPFIKMENLQINNEKNYDINYFNSLKYKNSIVFYNENGAFEFYNKLEKGTKLRILMTLEIMNQTDLGEIIEYQEQKYNEKVIEKNNYEASYNDSINKINELKNENLKLRNELNIILNSKGWKFIRKFDRIRKAERK